MEESTVAETVVTKDASITMLGLTNEERRVWEDWDRKNLEEEPTQKPIEEDVFEQYSSLEQLPKKSVDDVDAKDTTKDQVSSDADAKAVKNVKKHGKAVERGGALHDADSENATYRPASSKKTSAKKQAKRSKVTLSEQQFMEKFSSVLSTRGIEVLKLNSNKKWDLRYLAVSKEVSWVDQKRLPDDSGDRMHIPQGLLWQKKFSTKAKDQSIATIGKQGKGGVLFSRLRSAAITQTTNISDVPKIAAKFEQGNFKKPVLVSIIFSVSDGDHRTVMFYFKSREDAKLFCSGCSLICDLNAQS